MNRSIETFPGLTFTRDTAFCVLKVMLQPLKIDLNEPIKAYHEAHRYPRHLGDYDFVFIVELNALQMPQLSVVSDSRRPIATMEFDTDGIHVCECRQRCKDNVVMMEPAVKTCFVVIKHMLQQAWIYLTEHYRRLAKPE